MTNDLVPSMGSIIQLKSLLVFLYPNSSPIISCPGNFLLILALINFSNALSHVVTGSYPLPSNLLLTLKGLFSFLK